MLIKYRGEDYQQADDEKAADRIYMSSALTMETGTLLQHQPLIHTDYGLPNDQDCIDQFSAHANHSYGSNGAVESLQRDGSIIQQSNSFGFAASNGNTGPRYLSDRNEAASYGNAQHYSDSSSSSISTIPSSATSTLGYNAIPPANYYTGIPTYTASVSSPQSFVSPPYAGSRVPSTFDTSRRSLPSIQSPTTGKRDAYTASAASYISHAPLSPSLPSGYPYSLDSHRVLQGTAGLSLNGALPYGGHMANTTSHAYGTTQAECANFPWPQLEVLLDMTCEGRPVTPEVHAKVEKGLFPAPVDKKWTCYRRNYFSVNASFDLHPTVNGGRVYVKRNNGTEQVQAMGVRLQAAVDGSQGKNIELIQHTPKRDNGPKTQVKIVKLAPTPTTGRSEQTLSPNGVYQIPMQTYHPTGQYPGPCLPMQNTPDEDTPPPSTASTGGYYPNGSSHSPLPGAATNHTFERVQFKQATANNGKRRASQQFFHLILELFADVRKEGSETPQWVKVAQRVSDKIVVRGRSPSHYSNECQTGTAGRGGATGGGSGYGGSGGGSYSGMNGMNGMNHGGFRGVGGLSGIGGNGYGARHYGFHPSPEHSGSHSGSSASSIDGGPVDAEYPVDAVMSDADRIALHEHDGYQYYPSTIYEGVTQLPPLGKIESNARYSTEPRQYAVKAEYADAIPGARYIANGIGRYQGVDSSQGYFPDLSAGYT